MNEPRNIYLDHAATAPLDPGVLAVMQPYFSEHYGNPSSLHTLGQKAREAVDRARRTVAQELGCSAQEIIFTGSGTESDNMAILGIARAYAHQGKHIVTSRIEHEAVLESLRNLEKHHGFEVTYLPVGRKGIVDLEAFKKALRPDTILVSIMMANNEIGTLQPIQEMSEIIQQHKKAGVLVTPFFHTDACQAAGALSLKVDEWGVDALTLNGSKLYGPKGVGALCLRKGVELTPLMFGGGQERKRRPGTENVPAIVGLAEALRLAQTERQQENERVTRLRNRLLEGITTQLEDIHLNGDLEKRLPNNLNFTVKGIEGEILLMRLDQEGVYASAGSACTAGSTEPSHVLTALGVSKRDAYGSVRFSLGHSNTQEQIDQVIELFVRTIKEIRSESGGY